MPTRARCHSPARPGQSKLDGRPVFFTLCSVTNTNTPWRPLRERMAGQTGERVLVEGTPDYLLEPLHGWLLNAIFTKGEFTNLATSLQLRLRRSGIITTGSRGVRTLSLLGEDLLEAIDAVMSINRWIVDDDDYRRDDLKKWWLGKLVDLNLLLREGGSAWQPNDGFDGLTTRVDETVAEAQRTVVRDAPQGAAEHLKKAWEASYGYKPDPTVAYSEAVKAVEAAVIPVTIPNDGKATLGKALTHIKNTSAKWSLAIDDQAGQPASADAAIALIELLWHGQRDRHAGPSMKPATRESAQTAVHAAVTLVHWFTSGAIHKAP